MQLFGQDGSVDATSSANAFSTRTDCGQFLSITSLFHKLSTFLCLIIDVKMVADNRYRNVTI